MTLIEFNDDVAGRHSWEALNTQRSFISLKDNPLVLALYFFSCALCNLFHFYYPLYHF